MTLSDSRRSRRPYSGVEAATLARDGSPPIARITLSGVPCPLPRRTKRVHMSISFPVRATFPVIQAGRRPHLHFRGLLELHSRYGPSDRSTAQGGLCHEASIRPVAQPNRSPATRSIDNSLGGILLHW